MENINTLRIEGFGKISIILYLSYLRIKHKRVDQIDLYN